MGGVGCPAQLLVAYSPFSWIATGILGHWLLPRHFSSYRRPHACAFAHALTHEVWRGRRRSIRSKRLSSTDASTLNDFVLPSLTAIARKTFIDCEIVGPANLYWWRGNGATDLVGPQMDAVYLEPSRKFLNGIHVGQLCFP